MYYADVQPTEDPTKYYRQYFFTEEDREHWLNQIRSYGHIVIDQGFEETDKAYENYR